MHTKFLGVLTAALLIGPVATAQAVTLDVHGTFDLTDSGIYNELIKPGFEAYSPGDTINYTAQGSGAALNAARGLSPYTSPSTVDAVFVHAPASERGFVDAGASAEPLGRALFYNDYVIVGPMNDPAGVKTNFPRDAVGAYQAIAARGSGASADASFLTRDDISGTNTAEQAIWGQTTGVPLFTVAAATATAPRRAVPSNSPDGSGSPGRDNPPWYRVGSAGGQALNLDATSDCTSSVAPQGGCYTMVDRGTYYRELAAGRIPNLQIVAQNNAATAVGGESELTNPFHGYIVNTSKNKQVAQRLMDFLQSPAFQQRLVTYPGNGLVSVFPSAAPQLTAATIPTSAQPGSQIAISATLKYAPPVAQPIKSLPVQLQASPTGESGTFSDTGAPVATGADGSVSFTPTVGQSTTYYRLSTPRFLDDPSQSLFAPGTITGLGTQSGRVDVTPTQTAAPTTTVTVPAPTTPKPPPSNVLGISSVTGSSTGTVTLRLRLPGAGSTAVSSTSRVGGKRITFAKATTIRATGAATRTVRVKPGKVATRGLRGTRRLTVTLKLRFTPTGGTARTTSATVTVG